MEDTKKKRIAEDTSPVVERFLRYKLVIQGRSPKTVEEYRLDLHTFFVYQIGTLITTGTFGAAFLPGLIAVAAMVAIIVLLCVRAENKIKAEYALNSKK